MPKYLLVRTVGELSEEDLKDAFARENEVAKQMPDVRWIRSYYSAEEGKVYCEYEAPTLKAVYEFNRRAGLPIDHATVVQNLEPSMFR
jgi:Protein of unknown function (DUF4242)